MTQTKPDDWAICAKLSMGRSKLLTVGSPLAGAAGVLASLGEGATGMAVATGVAVTVAETGAGVLAGVSAATAATSTAGAAAVAIGTASGAT